jgi:hypothetical protein
MQFPRVWFPACCFGPISADAKAPSQPGSPKTKRGFVPRGLAGAVRWAHLGWTRERAGVRVNCPTDHQLSIFWLNTGTNQTNTHACVDPGWQGLG